MRLPAFSEGTPVAVCVGDGAGWDAVTTSTILFSASQFLGIVRPDPHIMSIGAGDTPVVAVRTDGAVTVFRPRVLSVGCATVILESTESSCITKRAVRADAHIHGTCRPLLRTCHGDDESGVSAWRSCVVENISESGALLSVEQVLPVATALAVRFKLRGQGSFELNAVVVRLVLGMLSPRVGVQFLDAASQDKARIAFYVHPNSSLVAHY